AVPALAAGSVGEFRGSLVGFGGLVDGELRVSGGVVGTGGVGGTVALPVFACAILPCHVLPVRQFGLDAFKVGGDLFGGFRVAEDEFGLVVVGEVELAVLEFVVGEVSVGAVVPCRDLGVAIFGRDSRGGLGQACVQGAGGFSLLIECALMLGSQCLVVDVLELAGLVRLD